MQDLEKLVDAAIGLRNATLRAEEQGIIHYGYNRPSNREEFLIAEEDDFKRLIKDRDYTVEKWFSQNYKYQYKSKISGLVFTYLTNELFYETDKENV